MTRCVSNRPVGGIVKRFCTAVFVGVLCMLSVQSLSAQGTDCDGLVCDVETSDSTDSFIGRGGLILPTTYRGAMSRTDAATCVGCSWRTRSVCRDSPGDG